MTYEKFNAVAQSAGLNVEHFFNSSNIGLKEQKEYQEKNLVPKCIALMFIAYSEAQIDEKFEKNKKAFFVRAKENGFEIQENKVILPILGGADFVVNDFESQFVSFSV